MATEYINALRNPAPTQVEACPRATQDIQVNTRNRQVAIDRYGYGPMNPNQPNPQFWMRKAQMWNTTPEQAMTARCGNCGVFIQSPRMLECIGKGLGRDPEVGSIIDKSELGYCETHDFKCAASRTCDTWVAKREESEEYEEEYEDDD